MRDGCTMRRDDGGGATADLRRSEAATLLYSSLLHSSQSTGITPLPIAHHPSPITHLAGSLSGATSVQSDYSPIHPIKERLVSLRWPCKSGKIIEFGD